MKYFEKVKCLIEINYFECVEDVIDLASMLYRAQKITLEQRNYIFEIA